MKGIYFHRGLLNGQVRPAMIPAELELVVPMPNGNATVSYRRTNWIRDGLQIFMPAVMVDADGSVTP